jgi:prepilin-type N-terminal cleavage/methylation domain-containing protein
VSAAVPSRRGFTIVEVMVTMVVLSMLLTFVVQILFNTVRTRDWIREDLEGPKIESAILDEIIRDLRFVYYRTGQFPADAGFWGRSRNINGKSGDRLDFLTCRRSRLAELEETNQAQVNAPLVEVGYACRASETHPELLELWRREDYFADDDPTDGGRFDLVYDRVREFELKFYLPPEVRQEDDDGLEEWDSKVQHKLPSAIVVRLLYDVRVPSASDRKPLGPAQGRVRRVILLAPSRSVPPADTAMGTMSS